ncbi:SIR2 family protein [Bradyrhizobium liaoningense]|uniref:SIR2 family protein n=1 Tax=Bradyrhizobium liaoningense TaxID=43992 RepID=UPI001BA5F525|nr:SIR2 family protein [Bradyrhizobium liaoningense]MBR0941570.1 SIR2 family protein [Bradyrhizobium liaoningense]
MSGSLIHRQIQRLAQRITAGEAVFFVGAGFSLDSEGNTAKLLIARLLVRFEALCDVLWHHGQPDQRTQVRKLQRGLRGTFKLGTPSDDENAVNDLFDAQIGQHLTTLAQSYYQINEWCCAAFDELLRLLCIEQHVEFVQETAAAEARLRDALLSHQPQLAPLRIGALQLELLLPFWRHCDATPSKRSERAAAGKVLFLDTMGFDDPQVMGGAPMEHDLDAVIAGAAGRLSPRHHALAWLAVEGLCPVLVTTNFDLLLESAYRLAGLVPWTWRDGDPQVQGEMALRLPQNRRYSHFARIADASQFFSHGQAPRAAQLYKIHGCVEAYRIARGLALQEPDGHAVLRALLPTMVFTFREIQNWREDTWSRDYLNTLLRTKTIVFSGYSGADPVIHDTFRTIYEEMAGYSLTTRAAGAGLDDRPSGAGEDAPAFFLGPEREFHGLEILRAASMAVGDRRPELTDHPNLLGFRYGANAAFPTLDELYIGLYHECARRLQRQALQSQLLHVYYQLVGRRGPALEAEAVIAHFDELCDRESQEGEAIDALTAADPAQRRRFRALTGWTWFFQRHLLREYALAETFLRHPGDTLSIERAALLGWYSPIGEHADRAAWGVVVELALRRAYASFAAAPPPDAWQPQDGLRAAEHAGPTVALVGKPVSRALRVELATTHRGWLRAPPRHLRALPPLRWELRNETVPWWREDDPRRPAKTPSALTLWQWAALPATAWSGPASAYFGLQESRT